ncbi:MAG: response regulator [Acidimicrobiales bacterium]
MARVLVVDDEAVIRHLVRLSLEQDGHEVTEAADGVEALEAIGPDKPDVIVLDLTMPHLDGWEVLVRLKAGTGDGCCDVPVILLTAADADADRIRAGVEGAVRYLTKPFDPDDLRREVREAMDVPEPELRRRAAVDALEHLAALERGDAGAERPPSARPHVARLGGPVGAGAPRPRTQRFGAEQVGALSSRQRELLRAVAGTSTVLAAAERLGVSRTNVYASLRRIARRLDVASVAELVVQARLGWGDDAA